MENFFDTLPLPDDSYVEEQIEAAIDDQPLMEDVEQRLEIAMYYRTLLAGSFFDSVSVAGEIVEKELKEFVRTRLRNLMGISTITSTGEISSPFNSDEIETLKKFIPLVDTEEKLFTIKQLVDKILARPQLLKKEAPTVNKPTVQTAQPTLKKKQGPTPITSMKKEPKAKEPPKQTQKQQNAVKDAPKFIEVNGQKYQLGRDKDGQQIYIKDGLKFILTQNDAGEYYFKSISKQKGNRQRYPTLTNEQMTSITAQQASQAAELGKSELNAGRTTNVGDW